MAEDIQFRGADTGLAVYALVREAVGRKVWNGTAFVTEEAGQRDAYDLPLAETFAGSRFYVGAFPTGTAVPAGLYVVEVFEREGAAPAESDRCLGAEAMNWDGAGAEIRPLGAGGAPKLTVDAGGRAYADLRAMLGDPEFATAFGAWVGQHMPAYTSERVLAIKAHTDLIGAAPMQVTSPVSSGAKVAIVQGDDYREADGRALTWTWASYTGPVQDGAPVSFSLMPAKDYAGEEGEAVLTKAGTASLAGDTLTVRIELTAAETSGLATAPPSHSPNHKYQIVATVAGSRAVTLAMGDCAVTKAAH